MMMRTTAIEQTIEWVFPKSRFVEYEPQDEAWCRFFGIGKEALVTRTVTFDGFVRDFVRNENGEVEMVIQAVPSSTGPEVKA